MKTILVICAVLFQQTAFAQKSATINFINDYRDVYHLSLIIYTPDGKGQTRVSNLDPGQTKTYTFPVGTEIFVADQKQEAYAMKGNDIKSTGIKPTYVLNASNDKMTVVLSTLAKSRNGTD